jgi:hypothetical protein
MGLDADIFDQRKAEQKRGADVKKSDGLS